MEVPKALAAKPKPWTPAEFAVFIRVAGEHRLGSLYGFMARTGLRPGEALGLCRDDVENDAGYLVESDSPIAIPPRSQHPVANPLASQASVLGWGLAAESTPRERG